MTKLLRHDRSVLREEDGAVEFKILAPMFASQFESAPHWSIRTWLKYLQTGEVPRRDFCVAWIRPRPRLFFTFEHFEAVLNEIKLIQHYNSTFCYRATSPSTSATLEAPTTRTPSSTQVVMSETYHSPSKRQELGNRATKYTFDSFEVFTDDRCSPIKPPIFPCRL